MRKLLGRGLAVLMLAGGLVPLTAGASWACSCAGTTFSESQEWRSVANKAPLIYVGEVLDHTESAPSGSGYRPQTVRYRISVLESLKGNASGTRYATTNDQSSACGVRLAERRRILIYDERVGLCGGYAQLRVAQRAAIVRAALRGAPIRHVVARGEWLWQIARNELLVQDTRENYYRYYPTDRAVARAARRIYRLNRGTIGRNPSRLRPGMRLRIPRLR
ncbi:MAG: LysM peptidoglycan-binding domain-containing protein [Frankia sp.]|nr:LysM peptidoglycan-binding domain-containing protein [Frankia sp.]